MTLAARLRDLSRQAGARGLDLSTSTFRAEGPTLATVPASSTANDAVDASAGPSTGSGAELRQRVLSLRRLLAQRETLRDVGYKVAPPAAAAAHDRTLPGTEIAQGVRLIERTYVRPSMPDRIALATLRSMPQQRHARLHDPDCEHVVSNSRLIAIDTETTGLAGGTGTRAFMIGVADLHQGRLRVRQLLITTLGGEATMMGMFRDWLRPDHVLVSYNGRSYDRPLLSTRLRLARLPDPLPALPHMDLLHVTRRAYRGVWANCRLATAERELLGVVRDDDLPGSEAPAAWLTYLRGGSGANLRRVATHNDQDLRSLMGLVAHFAAV
ncbi:MAG: ribonuclease H-like domain-containing protein [Lysobacterales bacterium]